VSASTCVDRAVLRKPYYGDTLTPRAENSLGNVNESRHNPQTISNAKTRDRQKDHRWNLSMQNMLSAIALLESSLDSSELVSPKLLPGCKQHVAFAPGTMPRSLLYAIKVSDAYAVHPCICNPNMFSRNTKHVLSSPCAVEAAASRNKTNCPPNDLGLSFQRHSLCKLLPTHVVKHVSHDPS